MVLAAVAVTECGDALRFASDRLKDNKEVALAAINQNGSAFEIISDKLKNDKEVALAAIKNYIKAFYFASDELKEDQEVLDYVLNVSKQNTLILEEKIALENDSDELEQLANNLKDNKAVELAAVNHKLRKDTEDKNTILAAIKDDKYIFRNVSKVLRNDREVALAALK